MTDFTQTIKQHLDSLSRNQRLVAEYIINHLDAIPFTSIQELARLTETSVASVVRFTQTVGYKGFSDFKDSLADQVKHRLRREDFYQKLDGTESSMAQVANQEILNINETIKNIHPDLMKKTIALIDSAEQVHTLGLGISNILAQLLAYELTQIGIRANTLLSGRLTLKEQVLSLTEKDLLIGFSYPPYSEETISALEFASEKNIPYIVVTNQLTAPSALQANLTLVASSENLLYTNSISAICVLINEITTGCAVQNKARTEEYFKGLNEINNKNQFRS